MKTTQNQITLTAATTPTHDTTHGIVIDTFNINTEQPEFVRYRDLRTSQIQRAQMNSGDQETAHVVEWSILSLFAILLFFKSLNIEL